MKKTVYRIERHVELTGYAYVRAYSVEEAEEAAASLDIEATDEADDYYEVEEASGPELRRLTEAQIVDLDEE